VTFAVAVPVPPVTAHVCAGLVGCVWTVTLYVLAVFLKVNETVPVPVTGSVSVVLSTSTNPEPTRFETDPPIVYAPEPVPVVVELLCTPLQAAITKLINAIRAIEIFSLRIIRVPLLFLLFWLEIPDPLWFIRPPTAQLKAPARAH
jgi:hypothetical protein